MNYTTPTLRDVIAARANVYRFLRPTPLYRYQGLCDLVGTEIYVKHENHLPVGAFKVRGGVNLAAHLSVAERNAGLFTASTGNHGQSIAYAAKAFGIQATIAMPEKANPAKVASMRALGANVVFHGPDFDSAREWIGEVAKEKGGRLVGPTETPLICGVATYTLEIIEDLPDVDVIIVPVGSGSGAAGNCIVAKAINPKIQVIACGSAQAPTAQMSWKVGKPTFGPMTSIVEGVATRVPFENTQAILRQHLDDFVLVDDDDITKAIIHLLEHTRNIAEHAGALPLATAIQIKDRLVGKKVAVVLCGGGLALGQLREILKG